MIPLSPRALGASLLLAGLATPSFGQDIVDTLAADPDFSTLVSAVQIANLANAIQNQSDITLFAPDNDAFAKIPAAELNALLANPSALRDVLLYHFFDGELGSTEVILGGQFTMAQGDNILTRGKANGVWVNTARVIDVDQQTSNGIIHRIDTVLTPGEFIPSDLNIIEALSVAPDFFCVSRAIPRVDITDELTAPGPLTMFVPIDSAFAKLPIYELQALMNDKFTLRRTLRYHLVPGLVTTSAMANAKAGELATTTVNSDNITFSTFGGELRVNDARVFLGDIQVANGVLHFIDRVLIPGQPTINQYICDNKSFKTLGSVLRSTGLSNTLEGPGPFTLFAPTDDAFAKVPAAQLQALLNDQTALTNVLLYHVLGEELELTGITAPSGMKTAAQGDTIDFTNGASGLFANDAEIVFVDIPVVNGVIHVITDVLLPPAP